MPIREIDLSLRAINYRFAEGNGKADGCVLNLVIVGEVVHIVAESVAVQPQLSQKALTESGLIVAALRRLYGKPEEILRV